MKIFRFGLLTVCIAALVGLIATVQPSTAQSQNCDRASYPDVCIAPAPPDLDCADVPYRRFRVLQPDPHGFDRDKDGVGCES